MAIGKAAATHPPITQGGVERLITRLGKDLDEVKASSASPDVIARAGELVSSLKGVLSTVIQLQPSAVGNWVLSMADDFKELTDLLNQALGTDRGRCQYTNPDGCIQSTKLQCEELGGNFEANLPCP